jgi:hypothetical protein
VLVLDGRRAGSRALVSGHFARSLLAHGGDDEFVAVKPRPDSSIDQLMRDGVTHPLHRDRGVPVDPAGGAERDGERLSWQRMQPLAFLGQRLGRAAAGLPVDPVVDLLAELSARRLQLSEGAVRLEQVRLSRHQVGLGDLDRVLRAALGLRVRGDAGADGHPVVPADLDDLRVAHRDPRDMLHRHRLLVVRQRIRRHPTNPPQRRVQTRHNRRHCLVPHRDHHPEPRPRQPRTPQTRAPPGDPRTLAPVPLHPQPRLRDPRPKHPPLPDPKPLLGLRHHPTSGALPAGEPIAVIRRCTTSARTRPLERTTNSSIFSTYPSIGRTRCSRVTGLCPASRNCTYRATVW